MLRQSLLNRLAIERKEEEKRSWLSLMAIVQSRPLSQSIKGALEKCLLEADLVDLAEREPRLATNLVNLIGMQAGHLNEDCRAAILEHVVVLACKLQSLKIGVDLKGELSDATLNALVCCAWMGSKRDGEERAARLADVLGRVAEVDPSGVFDVKGAPFVVQLCDTLPPRQARHLWRVREMLRLSPNVTIPRHPCADSTAITARNGPKTSIRRATTCDPNRGGPAPNRTVFCGPESITTAAVFVTLRLGVVITTDLTVTLVPTFVSSRLRRVADQYLLRDTDSVLERVTGCAPAAHLALAADIRRDMGNHLLICDRSLNIARRSFMSKNR